MQHQHSIEFAWKLSTVTGLIALNIQRLLLVGFLVHHGLGQNDPNGFPVSWTNKSRLSKNISGFYGMFLNQWTRN